MAIFIELFGWFGAIVILGTYALVSFSFLEPTGVWYQVLNVVGALGIVAVSFHKKAYQPAVLNVIWAVIALLAIINIIFKP